MRLERLNYNKIKIFLTYDDLTDRGLTKEDLWRDQPKVHQLFRDMMNEASDELGFEPEGPIAIEVFSLQAQGMVVIVTRGSNIEFEDEEDFSDDYIHMQVTLDESNDIFFEFQSIEDVIAVSSRLFILNIKKGRLYSFENRYYLELDEGEFKTDTANIVSILSEFGNPSTITVYRVNEYGKQLISDYAIEQIQKYFK